MDKRNAYVDNMDDDFDVDEYINEQKAEKKKQKQGMSNKDMAAFAGTKLLAVLGIALAVVLAVVAILGFALFGWGSKIKSKLADRKAENVEGEILTEEVNNGIDVVSPSNNAGEVQHYTIHDIPFSAWIDCNGEEPSLDGISNYRVTLQPTGRLDAESVTLSNVGDLSGYFLVNPEGFSEGDKLYSFVVEFNPRAILRLVKYAEPGGDEPRFVTIDSFSAERYYYDGVSQDYSIDSVDVEVTQDSIVFKNVHFPEENLSDLDLFSLDGRIVKVGNRIGNNFNQHFPTMATVMNTAYDAVSEEEVIESAGTDSEESRTSGFKYAGCFRLLSDSGVEIELDDEGNVRFITNYPYEGGNLMLEGRYSYDEKYSGYEDQGSEYFIHMHFPDAPNGVTEAEAVYDGEVSMLYLNTDGFGDMGTAEFEKVW